MDHNLLAAAGRMLSLAILVVGFVLFLRLLEQWRRGASPLQTGTAIARLRARAWLPLDAGLLLFAVLLPVLFSGFHPAKEQPAVSAVPMLFTILFYGIIMGGVLSAAHRTGSGLGEALGITRKNLWSSTRTGLTLGLAALPLVLLVAMLVAGAMKCLGIPPSQQAIFNTLADSRLSVSAQALLFFVAVVAAPVAEEAVFRGVLFPAVLRSHRLPCTLLLVNLLFALLHLHLPSFFPLLTAGICFSLGMQTSGALLTPIIMHAIFNAEMLLLFYAWPTLGV